MVYADADLHLVERLRMHLHPYIERGQLHLWDRLLVGSHVADVYAGHLDEADVVLLFISVDLVNSRSHEIQLSLARSESGAARVIPIWAGHVDRGALDPHLLGLGALPSNGVCIRGWKDKDAALADVAAGIGRAVRSLMPASSVPSISGTRTRTRTRVGRTPGSLVCVLMALVGAALVVETCVRWIDLVEGSPPLPVCPQVSCVEPLGGAIPPGVIPPGVIPPGGVEPPFGVAPEPHTPPALAKAAVVDPQRAPEKPTPSAPNSRTLPAPRTDEAPREALMAEVVEPSRGVPAPQSGPTEQLEMLPPGAAQSAVRWAEDEARRDCFPGGVRDSVAVRVRFDPDGSVGGARVVGGPELDAASRQCVLDKFENIRVASFRGDPAWVTHTIRPRHGGR
ncbi:hypothetical protein [Sorangium sp. So ce131]|uniref:hypothetical protein n=1 Tax=Sorangium sp. So ce131 TaxID=3133282 RepID=UPI003F61E6BF